MKSDKTPVIGFICVMLSCILVLGITIGLLSSANNKTPAAGATTDTTDTTDTTPNNTPETPDELPEKEPELIWGYEPPPNYGSSPLVRWLTHMGYKSDVKTFDIDNVKLTLAYGMLLSGHEIDDAIIEYYRNDLGLDVPCFEIYFADEFYNNIYTVREVKESFVAEKYRVLFVGSDGDGHYEFNHSEEITIPKELFTESEGIIRICVGGMNVAGNEQEYAVLCYEYIKYQLIENNKVVLSPCWEW